MGTGPGNINKTELKEWQSNALKFLAPLVILYTTQVVGTLQSVSFDFTGTNILTALIPTPFTWGGIVLYIFNTITDFFRKFLGDNR